MSFIRSNAKEAASEVLNGLLSFESIGIDPSQFSMPDSAIVDYDDLPSTIKWSLFGAFYVGFIAIGIYFFVQNYQTNLNTSFVSLDNTSGICSQVPQDITGDFLADTNGNYDSSPNFQYQSAVYALNLIGLYFTDAQWKDAMTNVSKALTAVGKKGIDRDLAWNLVVWGSFDVVDSKFGILEFYLDAEVNVILNKPINAVNFGSAASQNFTAGEDSKPGLTQELIVVYLYCFILIFF